MRHGRLRGADAPPGGRTPQRIDPASSRGDTGPGSGGIPGGRSTPPALRRKARAKLLNLVLPALAAAIAAEIVLDRPGAALLFALATLAIARLLGRFRYPLSLLPVSRATLAGVAPVIATAVISAVTALGFGVAIPVHQMVAIAVAAMVVAVATDVLTARWVTKMPIRVAVLGSPDFAVGLRRELRENSVSGIELVGWLNAGGELLDSGPFGQAAVERLRETIRRHRIDLVVRGRASAEVSGSGFGGARPFEFAAESLVDLPVRMMDGAQFYEERFGHVPLGMIDSAWYLFLMHPRYHTAGAGQTRALDLVIGGITALFALPLVALAALAIKLEDRGPVFYRQRRVGEGGREFEILKLRTMSEGAESEGVQWCRAGDSRITRVGAVLRRTHIDELPQLFNVLRGEMTLVGPRPERPEIVSRLEELFPHYQRRHLVKPGVTGWAQVRCGYAGSELGTAWKLCHDLFYLKHRTVLSDLLIMLETVAIAAKDAHRPLRMPPREFIFGPESGRAEGSNDSRPPVGERPASLAA